MKPPENNPLPPAADRVACPDDAVESALLANVVAASSQAIMVGSIGSDEPAHIRYINPAFTTLTGFTPAEVMGGEIEALVAPSDALEMWMQLTQDLEAGRTFTRTLPARRQDGSRFWASTHGYALRDAAGRMTHWVLGFTDVTASHGPLLELQRSETRYRLLAENSSDLITVLRFDGTCIYASPAIRSMLGHEPEELLQQPLEAFIHPDDCPKARRIFERHYHNYPENTFTHRLRKKDGSYLWCETTSKSTWNLEGDAQGGIIAVTRDIAKRRHAEEDLHAMHALLSAVYDTVPVGLCIIDSAGEILQCNEAFAAAFALTPAHIAGRPAREVLPAQAFVQNEHECECTSATGENFPAQIALTPLPIEPRPLQLVTLTDLRERRRMETRLREAQRLESLGTFAGGIAHDFNNLLAIILGYASLLRQTAPENTRVGDYGDTIMEAGRRGADVVRQLMLYANQHEPVLLPADAHEIISEVFARISGDWPSAIRLESELGAEHAVLPLDSEQIGRSLEHLLRNAREAIEGTGTVRVRTAERESVPGHDPARRWLQITVEDTGCGMDQATRERMFEPFFARNKGPEVRGLGLAVVYGIVRAHRGLIDVESAPGRGTRVHVLLPLPTVEPLIAEPVAAIETPAPRATVLLVEDEIDIGRLWCNLLPMHGWKILWARDGQEALKIFAEHGPKIDLLFSDIGLPDLDGWEVSTRLRAERPRLPVLLASGYFKPSAKAQAALAEPIAYIDKPYQPGEVLEKLNQLLRPTR